VSHAGAVAVLSLPVLGALLAGWVQLRNAARRSDLLPEACTWSEAVAHGDSLSTRPSSVYTAEEAPADLTAAEGSTLVARHQMWLAGIPDLTMHDQIRRNPSA